MRFFAFLFISGTVAAAPIEIPVQQDASVIKASHAIPHAADTSFGLDPDIIISCYPLVAEALFKANLSRIQGIKFEKAELVISSARLLGNSPAVFRISQTEASWIEHEVTWNTKPALINELGSISIESGENVVEVTDALIYAIDNGDEELSLSLAATERSHLVIPSQESKSESPIVYLRVTEKDVPQGLQVTVR